MFSASRSSLPAASLLKRFDDIKGAHTDCYRAKIATDVSLEDYAIAFFDSWVFRTERRLIALAGGKRADHADIIALANGTSQTLSEWHVVTRDADQVLLAVGEGPIRTWIMRQAQGDSTALYFGSAILPMNGATKIGLTFRLLMGFHRLYSRILLCAARAQLRRATT